jgi:hypothetical protein
MSVAAGVIGDLYLGTVLTAQYMATEHSAAAMLNCRHDLELVKANVPAVSFAPRRALAAEDIRDLYP